MADKAEGRAQLAPFLIIRSQPFWCRLKACFVLHVSTARVPRTVAHNQFSSVFSEACFQAADKLQTAPVTQNEESVSWGVNDGGKTDSGDTQEEAGVSAVSLAAAQPRTLSSSSAMLPQTAPLFPPHS